jgi:hypothetical protein
VVHPSKEDGGEDEESIAAHQFATSERDGCSAIKISYLDVEYLLQFFNRQTLLPSGGLAKVDKDATDFEPLPLQERCAGRGVYPTAQEYGSVRSVVLIAKYQRVLLGVVESINCCPFRYSLVPASREAPFRKSRVTIASDDILITLLCTSKIGARRNRWPRANLSF